LVKGIRKWGIAHGIVGWRNNTWNNLLFMFSLEVGLEVE
jgi:hypothetical protein